MKGVNREEQISGRKTEEAAISDEVKHLTLQKSFM